MISLSVCVTTGNRGLYLLVSDGGKKYHQKIEAENKPYNRQ